MTPSQPLRLGLVGAGSHANRNILPALAYLPVELVSIADVDRTRAASTARRFGAPHFSTSTSEMYGAQQLDGVVMCVSPQLHPDLAIEAFEAGLHVWTEKPPAVSSDRIDEMIRARGDRICVIGYKKAFMPATAKVRELLARPEQGELRTVLAVYPVDAPEAPDDHVGPLPVSNWLTSGCHPLSLLLSVAGPATSVVVHRSSHGGGACILSHANGAVSNLHLAAGASKYQPCERYTFYTETSSVEIDNSRKVTYQRGLPDAAYVDDLTFAPAGLSSGALVWEAQDTMATMQGKNIVTQGIYGGLDTFCRAVLSGTRPEIGSLEFARDVTLVYEAAQHSHGAPVEPAPLTI